MLATPIAASAQPVIGLYVGAGAGVNIMPNIQVNPNTIFGLGTANLKSEVGFAGVVSLGWGFGNGLLAELEGDYRNNPFNSGSGFLGGGTTGHGREQKYGPMVNVLYDFSRLTPWFVPYLGVGVGYQWANEHGVALTSPIGPSSLALKNQTEGSFAYQAIVGAAFPMAAIPGLAFTAEQRYMGLAGSRSYGAVSTVGITTRVGSVSLKNDHNNTILLGPPPVTPRSAGSCVIAMVNPAPALNPVRTLSLINFINTLSLKAQARRGEHANTDCCAGSNMGVKRGVITSHVADSACDHQRDC